MRKKTQMASVPSFHITVGFIFTILFISFFSTVVLANYESPATTPKSTTCVVIRPAE